MKLLFDENLSHHLVELLSDCYPESTHVRSVGLERTDDAEVWAYAAASGLTIVSKDSTFTKGASSTGLLIGSAGTRRCRQR